jgi:predicted glycogen debranching enzyme
VSLLAEVRFGREVCGNLDLAESREWLVTNGLGGYASGTAAGTSTRRYHGLLMAALQPPGGRTLLVAGIDERVRYAGTTYALAANRWTSGSVSPTGYLQIESFHLEGTKPVWRYALADALIEKRVWMKQGENTTFIDYSVVRASGPVEIEGKVLVSYRDFHSLTKAGNWQMQIEPVNRGLRIVAFEKAVPFYLVSAFGILEPQHEWYHDYFLPAEKERGLDDHEDRLYAATFRCPLSAGERAALVCSTNPEPWLEGLKAKADQSNHEWKLFQGWQPKHAESSSTPPADEPSWLWQLVLAADQFIVKRPLPDDPDGMSIIAGYPWFADWGRDTMIALAGLTLPLGRPEVARKILESFSRYVDGGMLPNDFPDTGGKPEYNTMDASLWYFEAIRRYYESTQDADLVRKLFPVLASMIDAHVAGTRHDIKVDAVDGLLYGGNAGVQLTWMDAKIGDWVVTPRTGKPVEINALWVNALATMTDLAKIAGRPGDGYSKLADKATKSFQKFWNATRNCCFDVIDAPGIGSDGSLRPNQIFAVSLPVSPLSSRQQKSVVDAVAAHLLTSYGLRSLSPQDSGYRGKFEGGPRERDSAYHQGTVWPWLLGSFALAHYKVYGDRMAAQSFLEPLGESIHAGGLGSIGEICGGDAPFPLAGCPAQAWSVAELIRAWEYLSAQPAKSA